AEGREQVRDAAEERRLWYVAATRVRDHLVIPAIAPAQKNGRGEQWGFVDESVSEVLAEEQAAGDRVFVYRGPVHPVAGHAPALPAVAAFTAVSPNPAVLQAYREWQARLQATLTQGREADTINAAELSPGYGTANGPAARHSDLRLGRAVHETLRQGGTRT